LHGPSTRRPAPRDREGSSPLSIDLWVGSATTLAGGLLGGVISFVLSRQQIMEARRGRDEEWRHQTDQIQKDRRFSCYSDFSTRARAYRGAIRSFPDQTPAAVDIERADQLAADADSTSSLVFVALESVATYDACRAVLKAIGNCQVYIRQRATTSSNCEELGPLEESLAASLRQFQVAARQELGVSGVDAAHFLDLAPRGQDSANVDMLQANGGTS
jgi:hypothetical protein